LASHTALVKRGKKRMEVAKWEFCPTFCHRISRMKARSKATAESRAPVATHGGFQRFALPAPERARRCGRTGSRECEAICKAVISRRDVPRSDWARAALAFSTRRVDEDEDCRPCVRWMRTLLRCFLRFVGSRSAKTAGQD